jgi:hypothetical protein
MRNETEERIGKVIDFAMGTLCVLSIIFSILSILAWITDSPYKQASFAGCILFNLNRSCVDFPFNTGN